MIMKQGDFSNLSKAYYNRPGYSERLLSIIGNYVSMNTGKKVLNVADVGAGTGKLTENLLNLDYEVTAIEPNDNMRNEGILYTKDRNVIWAKGSGEKTELENRSINWLLMGSSFHWVDFEKGINEFDRVLSPGGAFTAIWNPRNISASKLHRTIEAKVHEIADIKRVSSGSSGLTETLTRKLIECERFEDVFFMETEYELQIPKTRYMGAWHSTNDIQAQAGPVKWQKILKTIEKEIEHLDTIPVPYKSRAWTAFKRK